MRTTKSANGITLKAYAGTTGVLLAFNVTDAKRTGLLGFALERLNPVTKKWEWLSGMMPFPGQAHDAGQPIPTDVAPIQKFRWSDYRVHAMYGPVTKPRLLAGPTVKVATACASSVRSQGSLQMVGRSGSLRRFVGFHRKIEFEDVP